MQYLRDYLLDLSRANKTLIAIVVDMVGFAICAGAALWMLTGSQYTFTQFLIVALPISAISIGLAWFRGLYRSVVRYIGLDLLQAALVTALAAAIIGAVLVTVAKVGTSPIRWGVAYFAFASVFIAASRFLARLFLVNRRSRRLREKVAIYGAGSAGAQLLQSLFHNEKFVPVAILDDDPALQGERFQGIEVYSPDRLEWLIERRNIKRVLLAMPSASRRRRRQALERLSEHPVHVQTIPAINDIISGKAHVDDIKDVDVKDLLGRDPVPPNPLLLRASTSGKTVLVTGAAGSIGSELCRQILELGPDKLVLLEMCEASLYRVDRDLCKQKRKIGARTKIVPLLGSVHHENRAREIINHFNVQSIFHAAAYKHVPIVEQNLFEGIHNNIFGTLHTARAAIECGIETFVLISTDKAVNPTNIMGATKRMSELVLQALNAESTRTKCCMVRFGNVLESSGSVVPLFREQIRTGGPVTVTHRDIIRYFMTIPEAAQLVIQAAALAEGGDVFVLDMGNPVKIQDLACRMINLMGLTVRNDDNMDGDIEIEFIGLRPAEKLYEELLIGSNVSGTKHPRIMKAEEDFMPMESLGKILSELRRASENLDYESARSLLTNAVNEYVPTNGIDDLLWRQKAESDRIIDFPARPTLPGHGRP